MAYSSKSDTKHYVDPTTNQTTAGEARQYYKFLKKSYIKGELSGI